MTFETAFKRLKEKFANVDASILEDMAIQITLSDEDCGGTFYAAVKDHVLAVEPYDYKDNDAVIDITRAALAALLDEKMTIDKAIEKGDMSVMGDLQKVSAIRSAIKIPEKNTVTKKASTTKSTTSKATATKTASKTAAVKTTTAKAAPVKETPAKEAPARTATKATSAKKTTTKKTTK